MGQVWRATDTTLGRQVAIKILPDAFAADPDRLARFEREAKTLASLNHPHIAAIHGFEKSGGVQALVMELVEGEDLSQRITRGAIPFDEALPIAKQIAEALEAAHEQGIIHRDLKPANIKVRADGTVKVLDFGLAKAVDPPAASGVTAMNSPTLSVHATQAGIILGTAAYMSPEQARGKQARFVDLLEANTFRELSARPETLRQSLTPADTVVIIDGIQKLPALLDEVQAMIDRNRALRFVLTGSSARKLKHGRANLLAGRAWFAGLHPLVSAELGPGSLDRRLNVGSLPAVFDSAHPGEDLNAYVGVYLQEEIRAEGLLRSVETFSRLLEVAALSNGHILNYTSVASDVGMPPRTVREHFQVLEDTLIGAQLPAYRKAQKRKPVATSKFYFFDVGVANALMKRSTIRPGSELYGAALEHLIFLELRAYLDYRRLGHELTFWRTHAGHEVDFLIGDTVAVEVKASSRVSPRDLKGLRALSEDLRRLSKRIVVRTEPRTRTLDDGVVVMPVERFLQQLWADEILEP